MIINSISEANYAFKIDLNILKHWPETGIKILN